MKNRMKLLREVITPALAMAMVAVLVGLFTLQDSTPAHASSWHLDCPDTITEGDSEPVQVRRHGGNLLQSFSVIWRTWPGTAGDDDYHHIDLVQQTSSSHETRVGRMRRGVHTNQDDAVEGDETFHVGILEGGGLNCEITIVDDDVPRATGVEIVSEPLNDLQSYLLGESIDIDVTFDLPVRVGDNKPFVRIRLGPDGDPGNLDNWEDDPHGRLATYRSGSGTKTLTFPTWCRRATRTPTASA